MGQAYILGQCPGPEPGLGSDFDFGLVEIATVVLRVRSLRFQRVTAMVWIMMMLAPALNPKLTLVHSVH